MDIIERITRAIEPSMDDMGYELVLVRMADGSRRKTLTVMAERKDGKGMSFDDCTDISRRIGALLEVDDPISGAYNLEVSSPGIDRPLTKLKDFGTYAGMEAKVETHLPIEGRRRFKGTIKAEGDTIKMKTQEGEVSIMFSNIRTAKLIITDALIAAHLKKQN